jgi:S-adenosylmethionine hydrolase
MTKSAHEFYFLLARREAINNYIATLKAAPLSQTVITLLSDVGTRDTTVAVARSVIKKAVPAAVFVDISHQVAPYDLQHAAYLLLSAYRHFPQGTIHLSMVDVFSGDKPRILLMEKDSYFFVGPDNGIFPLAFGHEQENVRVCHEYRHPYHFASWIQELKNAIVTVVSGSYTSLPATSFSHRPNPAPPRAMPGGLECGILHIDRYGNVVICITREQFRNMAGDRPFRVRLNREQEISAIVNNYNDVAAGQPLCRFNDAGFLEVALNHDRASAVLGLDNENLTSLRYKTIKILF